MRYIAPVGTPISFKDLRNWSCNIVNSRNILEIFKQEICNKFKVRHCFLLSSGRAALYLLLRVFKELSGDDRNEVIIPSYNCLSVPEAIAKAGLKIRICDIDPNTLDYDFQKLYRLDFTKVLCIITSNLYGIPNNLVKLDQIAKSLGVLLIDDAAQCMGGQVKGKFSGTFGDAGIYSLGKGKNITSIEGGIIVTNSDDVASLVKSKIDDLPSPATCKKFSYVLQLLLYPFFMRPSLFRILANLPFLKLENFSFNPKFPVESYDRMLGSMGLQLFSKLEEITETRIENANYLKDNLDNIPFINFIKHNNYSHPVYLRFPLLINDKKIRKAIVEKLKEKALGIAEPYPFSVADIPAVQDILTTKESDAEKGRLVAAQLVTLPTHPYVTKEDLSAIISVIRSILKS